MPLTIRYEGMLCVPVVFCDHCQQEITSADDGNYQWLWTDQPARICFTHKACCDPFEHSRGGTWGCNPLCCLFPYLVNNLGINWRESKRLANWMSRM
jgi:hypothetical protein